jgi:hypothetical protein
MIGAIAVATLGVVVAGTWHFLASKQEAPMATTRSENQERKILYWTDPMNPGFKSDKPGKSPFMDMELVPVYADAHDSRDGGGRAASGTVAEGSASAAGGRTPGAAEDTEATTVSVRPEIVQSLGVRTYRVTRGSQARRIAVTGYLFLDARGIGVFVDLIGSDASLVRIGQSAEVRVTDVPDRTWSGTVERIEPDVDIGTRTAKARVRLSQTSAALQPNMFAEVTILGAAASKSALFIPREALIRTGTRNAVVLALGDGRFQPVAVTPGSESDDWIEIRSGIKEGDVVVTSGQFLIDSEASVRASFSRMQSEKPAAPGEAKTPAGTHTGHD